MRFIEISEIGFIHLIPYAHIYQEGYRMLVYLDANTLANLYINYNVLFRMLKEYKGEWVIFENHE